MNDAAKREVCCKCEKPATLHTISPRGEHYYCIGYDPSIMAHEARRKIEIAEEDMSKPKIWKRR